MVELIVCVKYICVILQKVCCVVVFIKGKQVQEVFVIFKFVQQSVSELIYKFVVLVMVNVQVKVDCDGEYFDEQDLYVKNVYVDEGMMFKCFQFCVQGCVFQIKKCMSYIMVVFLMFEMVLVVVGDSNKKVSK